MGSDRFWLSRAEAGDSCSPPCSPVAGAASTQPLAQPATGFSSTTILHPPTGHASSASTRDRRHRAAARGCCSARFFRTARAPPSARSADRRALYLGSMGLGAAQPAAISMLAPDKGFIPSDCRGLHRGMLFTCGAGSPLTVFPESWPNGLALIGCRFSRSRYVDSRRCSDTNLSRVGRFPRHYGPAYARLGWTISITPAAPPWLSVACEIAIRAVGAASTARSGDDRLRDRRTSSS